MHITQLILKSLSSLDSLVSLQELTVHIVVSVPNEITATTTGFISPIYSNYVLQFVLMEFNGDKMTEYDLSGRKVYEGGYQEDSQNNYVRSGEGTEFQEDDESFLYYGHFEKGERHGKGTLYKDGVPVFIDQWNHGTQG